MDSINQYFKKIDEVNECYMMMLVTGKVENYFSNSKKKLKNMLTAKHKGGFQKGTTKSEKELHRVQEEQ